VVDFIDMMDKRHITQVEKTFRDALKEDRSRIQLARISRFGMLELSRQKKQSTIQEISYSLCPYCRGEWCQAVRRIYGAQRVAEN